MQQLSCKHPCTSPKLQTPLPKSCFSTKCRDSQLFLLSLAPSTLIYVFCVPLHFSPRLILPPCLKSSYPETLGPHVPSCSSIPVFLMWCLRNYFPSDSFRGRQPRRGWFKNSSRGLSVRIEARGLWVHCSDPRKARQAAANTPGMVLQQQRRRRKALSSNNNQPEIRPARLSLLSQLQA